MRKDWQLFLEGLNGETQLILSSVVDQFFVIDKIDPQKFIANWMIIKNGGRDIYKSIPVLSGKSDLTAFGTETADMFSSPLDRPVGYGIWFVAAYPDVVKWFTALADKEETVVNKILGDISSENVIDDNGEIKFQYLRKIVNAYKEAGNILECLENL